MGIAPLTPAGFALPVQNLTVWIVYSPTVWLYTATQHAYIEVSWGVAVDPSEPMADRSSAPVALLATALPPLLEKRLPAYLDDLGTLVNLDSGTYDRDDVAEVGRWLVSRISSWRGATTEIHHSDQFADSFSVTLSGSRNPPGHATRTLRYGISPWNRCRARLSHRR